MSVENGVHNQTQFSVFLVNKPGVLSRVVHKLAKDKINIIALSMMDSTEHGVLRLVVEDAGRARTCLSELDVPKQETSVIAATLPNRPGALADVVERLAVEHINIHYAYCTTGPAGGKTIGVFKVADQAKAVQVLSGRRPRRMSNNAAPVRAQASRRR
ncbi:MAG: amino acid-binding protein [Planctomycetes bacterium]|nr:amino acid-binding protein [Planctomycetota bacterium]